MHFLDQRNYDLVFLYLKKKYCGNVKRKIYSVWSCGPLGFQLLLRCNKILLCECVNTLRDEDFSVLLQEKKHEWDFG